MVVRIPPLLVIIVGIGRAIGVTESDILDIDIGEREETLIRVLSKRNALDEIVSSLTKGERVLVEGRLQTATVKSDDGSERRIYEIDANTIEKLGEESAPANQKFGTEEIVKFESDDLSNELINEDEIPF